MSVFEKNWIRTGLRYLLDFYNEISLRVIQDVTNRDGTDRKFVPAVRTASAASVRCLRPLCCYLVHTRAAPQSQITPNGNGGLCPLT